MKQKRSGSLLEPTQLAILAALGRGSATAKQLAAALPELSRPTLYRRLKQLERAGLIRVETTRPVRGALERTWALAVETPQGPRAPQDPPLDVVTRVFTAFVAAPLSATATGRSARSTRALTRAEATRIHVTPAELEALRVEFDRLLRSYRAPAPGRRAVHVSLFTTPA